MACFCRLLLSLQPSLAARRRRPEQQQQQQQQLQPQQCQLRLPSRLASAKLARACQCHRTHHQGVLVIDGSECLQFTLSNFYPHHRSAVSGLSSLYLYDGQLHSTSIGMNGLSSRSMYAWQLQITSIGMNGLSSLRSTELA